MARVSSLSSAFSRRLGPEASAAHVSARLVMLLDPGGRMLAESGPHGCILIEFNGPDADKGAGFGRIRLWIVQAGSRANLYKYLSLRMKIAPLETAGEPRKTSSSN